MLAILVRVLEQAVRDGITDHNRARITGWQREYQLAEDELDDLRSLACRNGEALEKLAAALVARSTGHYAGWGDVVEFTRLHCGPHRRNLQASVALTSTGTAGSGRSAAGPRLDPGD